MPRLLRPGGFVGSRVLRLLAVTGMISFFAACGQDRPTTPTIAAPAHSASITSEPGRFEQTGFYWLPPLVAQPAFSGIFDPNVTNVEVKICVLGASQDCEGDIVTLSRATTPAITVDRAKDSYNVVWHSKDVAVPGTTYRIRAFAGSVQLGQLDVPIVNATQDLKDLPDAVGGLVADHPLRVRFRLETGIVGDVHVSPPTATIREGETQELTATVFDLHGNVLTGRELMWFSPTSALDLVDPMTGGSVFATRVTAGTATFIASVDGVAATATLTVESNPHPTFALGRYHTCGIDASDVLYCWGANFDAQLGNGTSGSYLPNPFPYAVSGGSIHFKKVAAGAYHTCAVSAANPTYCWGLSGIVDNTTRALQLVPTALPMPPNTSPIQQEVITAGDDHACGTIWGRVVCWGLNGSGQLGDGTTTANAYETLIQSSLPFIAVQAGTASTCGLTVGRRVYCWGDNSHGQLGDGTTAPHTVPMPIASTLQFIQLSMHATHACALTADGTAWCWGDNWARQLGDGGTENWSTVPVQVATGTKFASISAGGWHTCALTSAGAAYCWGANTFGEIGDGTNVNRAQPTAVSNAVAFNRIFTGDFTTCALTATGSAYCWGQNNYGQLGDGSTTGRNSPVVVPGVTFR